MELSIVPPPSAHLLIKTNSMKLQQAKEIIRGKCVAVHPDILIKDCGAPCHCEVERYLPLDLRDVLAALQSFVKKPDEYRGYMIAIDTKGGFGRTIIYYNGGVYVESMNIRWNLSHNLEGQSDETIISIAEMLSDK